MRVAYKPNTDRSFGGSYYYNYFDIAFSGFSFDPSCSISDVKVEITSTNSPGTGHNNTVDLDTKGCAKNRINFMWTANREFSDYFGDQGLSADNTWATTEYLIFYITIQSPSPDLPVLHHDYIYAVGTYYHTGPDYYAAVRDMAYLPAQDLATSVTLSTLTTNRGANTEFAFEIDGLKTDVGSGTSGYILLAEFISSTGWTGSSDPLSSYTNTANNE